MGVMQVRTRRCPGVDEHCCLADFWKAITRTMAGCQYHACESHEAVILGSPKSPGFMRSPSSQAKPGRLFRVGVVDLLVRGTKTIATATIIIIIIILVTILSSLVLLLLLLLFYLYD